MLKRVGLYVWWTSGIFAGAFFDNQDYKLALILAIAFIVGCIVTDFYILRKVDNV